MLVQRPFQGKINDDSFIKGQMLRQLLLRPKNIFRFIQPVHVHLKTDHVVQMKNNNSFCQLLRLKPTFYKDNKLIAFSVKHGQFPSRVLGMSAFHVKVKNLRIKSSIRQHMYCIFYQFLRIPLCSEWFGDDQKHR